MPTRVNSDTLPRQSQSVRFDVESASISSEPREEQTGWSILGESLRSMVNGGPTTPGTPLLAGHTFSSSGNPVSHSKFESIEYYPANNAVYREWLTQQPHDRHWDKWLVMGVIGLLVGATAFSLGQSIEILFSLREAVGRYFLTFGYSILAWICYVSLSAAAAFCASWLVVRVAPAAASSGIPSIMAFLNGVRMPHFLGAETFVVKFMSCALAVAAGLPVGPEGPLIHMGAIIGSAVSSMHSTSLKFDLGILKHLRGDNHKRDFVTAGVAAGVAAAFDAPIGGLLFAFEDVASFWQSHLGWQVFFACTVAVLTQMLLQSGERALRAEGQFGFFNNNVEFEVGVTVYNHVLSIIPAAIIGITCGILAVIFTKVNLAVDVFRAKYIKKTTMRRLSEVTIMTLIFVGGAMLLPHAFPCLPTACTVSKYHPGAEPTCPPAGGNSTSSATNEDLAMELDPFTCNNILDPDNSTQYIVAYNSMATLVTPLGQDTVSRLFARGVKGEFGYTALIVMLFWYFCGAAWAAGMDISSGLFVPMFVIGAVVGRLVGLVAVDMTHMADSYGWMPASEDTWKWIDPGVFAVIGAAAFMGGVTRLTIALAAIMMEVSNDVQMLIPIMVAILAAKSIADRLLPHSYYHALMDHNAVPFLPPNPHTDCNLDLVPVQRIMAAPVITLPQMVTLRELKMLLPTTSHNGFPIIKATRVGMVCLGLITRQAIEVILEFAEESGSLKNLPVNITYPDLNAHVEAPLRVAKAEALRRLRHSATPTATLAPVGSWAQQNGHFGLTIDSNELPASDEPIEPLDETLDLSRYMNESLYMVRETFSTARAYQLFVSMGLRHIVVVDEVNRVRGIVTRKDLLVKNLMVASVSHR